MTSRATNTSRQSDNPRRSRSLMRADTPLRVKVCPKMLAARSTRLASAPSASRRACTMPTTVSGSEARAPPRRRGSAPRGRTGCRRRARAATPAWSASRLPPRICCTRFWQALRVSGRRLTRCRSRSCQRPGNCSSTSGRAKASTMNGRSRSARSAASMNWRLGRSPQWMSSSISRTGWSAHSAASQSSQALRIWSPMRRGSCRAACSAGLPSSGKGTPVSSPRNSVTRRRGVAGR